MTNSKPHVAQVFVWWVTGVGIICAGIWAMFIYFDKPADNGGKSKTIVEKKATEQELADGIFLGPLKPNEGAWGYLVINGKKRKINGNVALNNLYGHKDHNKIKIDSVVDVFEEVKSLGGDSHVCNKFINGKVRQFLNDGTELIPLNNERIANLSQGLHPLKVDNARPCP